MVSHGLELCTLMLGAIDFFGYERIINDLTFPELDLLGFRDLSSSEIFRAFIFLASITIP